MPPATSFFKGTAMKLLRALVLFVALTAPAACGQTSPTLPEILVAPDTPYFDDGGNGYSGSGG